jgi:hypothetical protein
MGPSYVSFVVVVVAAMVAAATSGIAAEKQVAGGGAAEQQEFVEADDGNQTAAGSSVDNGPSSVVASAETAQASSSADGSAQASSSADGSAQASSSNGLAAASVVAADGDVSSVPTVQEFGYSGASAPWWEQPRSSLKGLNIDAPKSKRRVSLLQRMQEENERLRRELSEAQGVPKRQSVLQFNMDAEVKPYEPSESTSEWTSSDDAGWWEKDMRSDGWGYGSSWRWWSSDAWQAWESDEHRSW